MCYNIICIHTIYVQNKQKPNLGNVHVSRLDRTGGGKGQKAPDRHSGPVGLASRRPIEHAEQIPAVIHRQAQCAGKGDEHPDILGTFTITLKWLSQVQCMYNNIMILVQHDYEC